MPLALPWISGEPASLFWRVRALGPKGYSQWSTPGAFNMRWTQQPRPLKSGPGFIRWSTVDGATGYQVWFLNANDSLGKVISTITNVADEREYYVSDTVPSTVVYWRIRAVRSVYGSAKNNLPAFSYGPWSHVFKSTNPPPASVIRQGDEVVSTKVTGNPLDDKYARLRPLTAVSDVVSTAGHAKPHSLVPAITVGGNPTTPGNLYRIYMFTDRDCVNRVFTGYPVTSPAYAPRSTGGAVLPEGAQQMADGTPVTPTELGSAAPATGTSAGAPSSATASTATTATPSGPAKIDLWDTRGRYFVVAIPVVAIVPPAPATGTSGASGPTGSDRHHRRDGRDRHDRHDRRYRHDRHDGRRCCGHRAATDPNAVTETVYQDLELPQDVCSKGRFITFGKASRTPELTSGGTPTAVGLSPAGRLLSAVHSKPAFYGSPLVTWEPASGAIGYQVQWSKSSYPWKTAGSIKTPATSTTLPLKPGTWWYRVRGINDSLPGNQLMSWSAQVPVVITRPTFGVLHG